MKNEKDNKDNDFEELKDELFEIANQITDELTNLVILRDKMKSIYVKTIFNNMICSATYIVEYAIKIINMMTDTKINMNNQISTTIDNYVKKHENLSSQIKSAEFKDIKRALVIERKQNAGLALRDYNDMRENINILYEGQFFSVKYALESTYYALTINDYDKHDAISESVKNLINTLSGEIPIISVFNFPYNIVRDIADLSVAFDDNALQDNYFNEVDRKLSTMERQLGILNSIMNFITNAYTASEKINCHTQNNN